MSADWVEDGAIEVTDATVVDGAPVEVGAIVVGTAEVEGA